MLATYSFKCHSCGHAEDRFIHRSERINQTCTQCAGSMKQVIHHAPKLDWSGMAQGKNAGPEFIDRFEKNHKDRKAYEDRKYEEHGDYGTAPGS